MHCMPAVSDRHLERHHKQVPRALIVTAAGRFTMMDHFRACLARYSRGMKCISGLKERKNERQMERKTDTKKE